MTRSTETVPTFKIELTENEAQRIADAAGELTAMLGSGNRVNLQRSATRLLSIVNVLILPQTQLPGTPPEHQER
jgi:hypothetical protein